MALTKQDGTIKENARDSPMFSWSVRKSELYLLPKATPSECRSKLENSPYHFEFGLRKQNLTLKPWKCCVPITNVTDKRKPASLGTDRMMVKYASRPTIYKIVSDIYLCIALKLHSCPVIKHSTCQNFPQNKWWQRKEIFQWRATIHSKQ
jgi:hypothetical protein